MDVDAVSGSGSGGSGTESAIRRAFVRRSLMYVRREAWSVGTLSQGVELRDWRASWRVGISGCLLEVVWC